MSTYFEVKGEDFSKSWCFSFFQSSPNLRVIKNYLDLKQELFQCLWLPPSKGCSVPSGLHIASEGLLFPVGFTLAEHMKSSLDGGWLSAVKCDTDLHLPLALTPAPYNSHHAPKNEFRKPFDTSSSRSHLDRGIYVIYSQEASVLSTMATALHQWVSAEEQTGVTNRAQCAHHIKLSDKGHGNLINLSFCALLNARDSYSEHVGAFWTKRNTKWKKISENQYKTKRKHTENTPKQQETPKGETSSGLVLLPIKSVGVLLSVSKLSQRVILPPMSVDQNIIKREQVGLLGRWKKTCQNEREKEGHKLSQGCFTNLISIYNEQFTRMTAVWPISPMNTK